LSGDAGVRLKILLSTASDSPESPQSADALRLEIEGRISSISSSLSFATSCRTMIE